MTIVMPKSGRATLVRTPSHSHLSAIMQKLDAHSRIEAIRVAEERGWL